VHIPIALVGWAEVQLGLVEGILYLIGKHTRRETRHEPLDTEQVGVMQSIVVDE
jgi:hypothetical protein